MGDLVEKIGYMPSVLSHGYEGIVFVTHSIVLSLKMKVNVGEL